MVSTIDSSLELSYEPRVAVIGVGGAGCNVVSDIYGALCPVDTIAVNTDREALKATSADNKIYICKEVTKGEGTRGDAALGRKCAKVHETEIYNALAGHDVVFIVAGLGGGTGTGAVSVVAEICDRLGVMTFAIVIEPFSFEGDRMRVATEGLRSLRAVCPSVFRFQNDRMVDHIPDAPLNVAMREVNKCIRTTVMETVADLPAMVKGEIKKVNKTISLGDARQYRDSRDYGMSVLKA